MAEGLTARRAVLALLDGVLDKGVSLAEQGDAPLAGLSAGDRARAQRLASAVLRQAEPIDRMLGAHLHKEPPLAVLNILRLAVTELAEGGAAHGVVNSAVELARRDKTTQGLAGLVNAVLRKFPPPVVIEGPVQRLPGWLRQALVARYGKVAVGKMEEVQSRTPVVDLTLRRGTAVDSISGGEVLPTGSLRLAAGGQISALPGFAEGTFWVQDAAAALAVRMLGDVSGLSVLDLCAAPGGKTLQLADGGAEVTALDISGPRLVRLQENLARTGLRAKIVTADALQWAAPAPYDAILLDAPCSASGIVRRHPDVRWLRRSSDIDQLVAIQARLLNALWPLVRPGGRLLYSTCSVFRAEGENQIQTFLAHNTEALLLPSPGHLLPFSSLKPGVVLDNPVGEHDGFYYALLQKRPR